jgi:hypothetical protein
MRAWPPVTVTLLGPKLTTARHTQALTVSLASARHCDTAPAMHMLQPCLREIVRGRRTATESYMQQQHVLPGRAFRALQQRRGAYSHALDSMVGGLALEPGHPIAASGAGSKLRMSMQRRADCGEVEVEEHVHSRRARRRLQPAAAAREALPLRRAAARARLAARSAAHQAAAARRRAARRPDLLRHGSDDHTLRAAQLGGRRWGRAQVASRRRRGWRRPRAP